MKKIISFLAVSGLSAPAIGGDFIPANNNPVEGQYIVVLKDDSIKFRAEREQVSERHARKLVLDELGKRHKANRMREFEAALQGGVVNLSEAEAKKLANDPSVAFVEQDAVVQFIEPRIKGSVNALSVATQFGVPSWGLSRIDQRNLPLDSNYNYDYTGKGVTAYVIDTGIYYQHSDFGIRASVGFDALGGNGVDCNGHGTHVAGTIGSSTYGVAKEVNLVGVRVLDCTGSGTWSGVINGIAWVTANAKKPAVANMSLGGGANTALDQAVKSSIASGVTYVVAAGNESRNPCSTTTSGGSPARVAQAITVGATGSYIINPNGTASIKSYDERANYSNYGSCLDIFAPGTFITSTWNTSNVSTNTISGTSMATPHVTGVIALYLQTQPLATPSALTAALKQNATASKLTSIGSGSPNALLYSLPKI